MCDFGEFGQLFWSQAGEYTENANYEFPFSMRMLLELQISRMRKAFLRSVLRQEMAWYDINGGGNFASRLTDNLEKIKEGICEKVAIFAYLIASFFACVFFSLYYGWRLTLVVLSCAPFSMLATALAAKVRYLKFYNGWSICKLLKICSFP